MRHRRSTHATLGTLAIAAAVGTSVPLACGGGANVSQSSGTGGGGHASSGHTSSSHAGTGAATSSSVTGGGPGTGGMASTGGMGGANGGASGTASGTGAGGMAGTGGASASGSGGATTDAATDAPMETTVTLNPGGQPLPGETTCTVVETTNIPEPDFNHLNICTPITYATNPPSGGNHWPIWAQFTQYTTPIPREMYVHDLEHGAIVLSYNCPSGCPNVVSALQMVFASQVDPICLAMGGGPVARMVLTPDPLLSTPIAASAWGATYTATCIDTASLLQFVKDHYGQGREDFCTDGFTVPACTDAGDDGGDGG